MGTSAGDLKFLEIERDISYILIMSGQVSGD